MTVETLAGAQIRMARAFLGWTIADLAERAGIGEATVKALEKTDGVPIAAGGIAQTLAGRQALRGESLERVRKAMTKAGITFLPDDGKAGVGVRGRIRG